MSRPGPRAAGRALDSGSLGRYTISQNLTLVVRGMADSAWVAVIGIVSTGAVGIAGAYFAYKAQRTPLRQALYEKQLNVLSDFSVLGTRACKLASLLTDASKLDEVQLQAVGGAWDEVQEQMLEVVQRGSIILPSTVYGAVTQVRFMADRFDEAFVKGVNVSKAYYDLMGAFSQAAMVSRMLLGADALSTESLSLHSRNGYGAFEGVEVESMARLSKFFWSERRRKKPGPVNHDEPDDVNSPN